MIVDCHTQIWERSNGGGTATATFPPEVPADAAHHLQAADPVDRAIVLAFKSRYLESEIPNHFVADYVRRNAAKMIGFAGIDPTEKNWKDDLKNAHEELQLRGVVVSPTLQNFHPADTVAMELYNECVSRGLPIVFDQHHDNAAAKMEFARPMLIDEVAREFPDLRIVISHMGYPWIDETVVLLAKHTCVYADIAGLHHRQWLSYNALMTALEYGVMDKLLFASDFPHRSPAECIEALYSINQVSHGTTLRSIPREQLRGIVERNALKLLGIEKPKPLPNRQKSAIFVDDDQA